jgi:hypothetical protein
MTSPRTQLFTGQKNKATTANLATIWEIHGQQTGTNITPGQAFSDEWGFGQTLPLREDFSRLLKLGVIRYDQWQVTGNSGPTQGFPYYLSHAIGFQTNFILPAKARPECRVMAFGFSWTLRIPKPQPPAAPPLAPATN